MRLKSRLPAADRFHVRLLLQSELPEVPIERALRHSVLGGFVQLLVIAAPAVAAVFFFHKIVSGLHSLPWITWCVVGPMIVVGGALYLFVLSAARTSAMAGLLPTNWVLRVSSSGIALQLRSFRNAHFRQDVPTVLWLDPGEVVRARRVIESGWVQGSKGRTLVRNKWLELELANVDCAPIEKRLAEERADQGPEIRVLGIKTHSRFDETPVYFVRPGVLRVEWLGKSMLEALREQVEIAPDAKVDIAEVMGGELEPRVRALCARGWSMVALRVVQRERGLGWSEAKKFVEDVQKRAA